MKANFRGHRSTAGPRPLLVRLALALTVPACGDPVTDTAIAALGPEDPNVPPGPSHRPGQPCLLCHRDGGRAQAFTLAGTVYADVSSSKTVGGAKVLIVDSAKARFSAESNCAGNFFVRSGEFAPTYPYWVTLRAGTVQHDMASPVYREGSCGACHADPRSPSSPGHVYVVADPTVDMLPPSVCP
ncbi:MAG: hypothetical protein M3O36_21825 [Myxococcota bacterium]|nr:hypothetical protein [Myxococcota bacterium]